MERFLQTTEGRDSPPSLWRPRTSADPGGGVEVVLMSAGVVLAFPEEQHPGGVTARRARRRRVAGQTLAVAGWPRQRDAGVRQ